MKAIKMISLLALVAIVGVFALSCGDLDKAELGELLNREYDPNGYTSASYQNYLQYYQQAQDVYTSQNTTNYRIEVATVNLLKAIDDLVPIADFSALLAELDYEVNPMIYTSASYQLYKTVYDSALIVASNELSKQSAVNNAERNLKMARQALVRKTDTTELQNLISEVQDISASKYTASSYQRFLVALSSARALIYDDSASESDVRLATNGLMQAKAGLIELGNADALSELIADLEYQYFENTGVFSSEQRYSLATLKLLREEIDKARSAISNKDASAEDLEKYIEKLNNVADGMVDKIALHEVILKMNDYVAMKSKYTSDSYDNYILEITKAMLLTEKYDPSIEEIQSAVAAVLNAEQMLVRKSISASGRTDFDLASMEIDFYGYCLTVRDYFNNYVGLYGKVFDCMTDQFSVSEFKIEDGYYITILPDSLLITLEEGKRDALLTVMGIAFTMDEYTVTEMLGAPTSFSSDGVLAVVTYADDISGINCELQFSCGSLTSVLISK